MTATEPRRQPDPDATEVARGGALNLGGSLVTAVLNFGVILAITRGMETGRAGAFLEATALYRILFNTFQLGADTGLVRFLPRALAHRRPENLRAWARVGLVPVLAAGLAVSVAAYLLAEPLAGILVDGPDAGDFSDAFRVMGPLVVAGSVSLVLQAGTRAMGTMLPAVVTDRLCRPVLQQALVAVSLALGASTTVVAWAWVGPLAAMSVPLALWFAVLVRRAEQPPAPDEAGTADDSPTAEDLPVGETPGPGAFWRFATPRAVSGTFQVAILWLDVLLVGALAGSREAAVYSASSRWLVAGLFVALAINQAFQPRISYVLGLGDLGRAARLFQTTTAWAVVVVWPVYLVLAIYSPVLVNVFGTDYGSGAVVITILALGGLVSSGCGPVDMVLVMAGRSSTQLFNTALALVINVGLDLALIPSLGITGAALAWVAAILVTNLLPVWQVWRHTGLHPIGRELRRAVPATVGITGGLLLVGRLLLGPSLPVAVVAIVGAGLVHLVVLRWLSDVVDPATLRTALRRRQAGNAVRDAAG